MASGGEDTSDEIFNFKCTACAKRNWNKKAVKYCVECQGYCCQACVDTHEFFPTLAAHNLLDRSTIKSLALEKDLPEIPTERCSIHETNLMSMYCGYHDVVGCTICMALEHRTCTDVQSIQDEIDKLFRHTDFEIVCQNLRKKKSGIEKTKETTLAHLEDLSTSKDEAVKAIKEFRKELESYLGKLEEESIKEVEKEFCKVESVLKNQIDKLESEMDRLKQAADYVEKSEGNKAQQFVSMKAAQKNVAEADQISNTLNPQAGVKIEFVLNQNIRNYLKQELAFGTVTPATMKPKQTTLYVVKGVREIDIRTQNDSKQGDIHGSCLIEEGLILLADFNNQKLKAVDTIRMSVVDQCNLPANPISVCCTKPKEAAITLSNNIIQFVSLDNPMSPTSQIKLNHGCDGLCYHNNKLYVSDGNKSVYIHDIAGNLLQQVSKDKSGNDIFTTCRKIALSDDGDKIYVADTGKGVVTLDIQGNYIETYSDIEVTQASAVCTDYKGNLFVCGKTSNNAVQITQNGKKKFGEVMKRSDGVINSLSITFDPRRCTLVITQCNNNKVMLFDLQ